VSWSPHATVIGGGLAGCEAAWQLARRGVRVALVEMKPVAMSPAHQTPLLCELVCSNSLRSDAIDTGAGLLKAELRRLGSLVMACAEQHRVPAGEALAVERFGFGRAVTAALALHPNVRIERRVCDELPDGPVIMATGPLTGGALARRIRELFGGDRLYFYDAIAPIVTAESIDMTIAYRASRYGKGGDDYINCPLDRETYHRFVAAVLAAEKVPAKSFERTVYFEGCMPIEEMARRGRDTLAFGPMRPVGLVDPRRGVRPHAVVQLRQDDAAGTLYNIVGFQTKMTYPAQRRVFRMIPGLAGAEFVRLGSLHRNTFVNSPELLRPTLQLRSTPRLFLAGQIIGVEGYIESAASGMLAGINAARLVGDRSLVVPPATTAHGALLTYVTQRGRRDFQPMNANYGLFPSIDVRARGRERRRALGDRALRDSERWMAENDLLQSRPGAERAAES